MPATQASPDDGEDEKATLSTFIQRHIGLVSAQSLFLALTVFVQQSRIDDSYKTYLSFWFLAATLTLLVETLRRTLNTVESANGIPTSVGLIGFWTIALASAMGIIVFWLTTSVSVWAASLQAPRYWIGLPLILLTLTALVVLAARSRRPVARGIWLGMIGVLIALTWIIAALWVAPGGMWISPPDHASETHDVLFSAHAYPTKRWNFAVDHVAFTALVDGEWQVACEAHDKKQGSKDVYECHWGVPNTANGPIQVSFDVYGEFGPLRKAPNGLRSITVEQG